MVMDEAYRQSEINRKERLAGVQKKLQFLWHEIEDIDCKQLKDNVYGDKLQARRMQLQEHQEELESLEWSLLRTGTMLNELALPPADETVLEVDI